MFMKKDIDNYFSYMIRFADDPNKFHTGRISAYSSLHCKELLRAKFNITDENRFYVIRKLTINLKGQ